jgi:hypothetical protein
MAKWRGTVEFPIFLAPSSSHSGFIGGSTPRHCSSCCHGSMHSDFTTCIFQATRPLGLLPQLLHHTLMSAVLVKKQTYVRASLQNSINDSPAQKVRFEVHCFFTTGSFTSCHCLPLSPLFVFTTFPGLDCTPAPQPHFSLSSLSASCRPTSNSHIYISFFTLSLPFHPPHVRTYTLDFSSNWDTIRKHVLHDSRAGGCPVVSYSNQHTRDARSVPE